VALQSVASRTCGARWTSDHRRIVPSVLDAVRWEPAGDLSTASTTDEMPDTSVRSSVSRFQARRNGSARLADTSTLPSDDHASDATNDVCVSMRPTTSPVSASVPAR
jgi:hypothetical protein